MPAICYLVFCLNSFIYKNVVGIQAYFYQMAGNLQGSIDWISLHQWLKISALILYVPSNGLAFIFELFEKSYCALYSWTNIYLFLLLKVYNVLLIWVLVFSLFTRDVLNSHLFTHFFLFMCRCVCPHGFMCIVYMQIPVETREYWIPWKWSSRQLWASCWRCWDQNSGPLKEQ